jgi:Na+-transporting methylmalonyl-CoA/oxaloacetate decarboxylase gamma subunit
VFALSLFSRAIFEQHIQRIAERRVNMWGEAIRVAIVGFSVVFVGLLMLAAGVKIMSLFFKLGGKENKERGADHA